ncbi:sensor histidine kinase [Halodurantibacterium flavum]|uniref:histidine kinase n=1 Tax=Halodurantibacterium flavum TaxID=1382802 RepID=A0ABW4S2H5_9RHOB
MRQLARGSIQVRLAWRLILLQVAALTIFAVIVGLPWLENRTEPRLDEKVIDQILEAFDNGGEGFGFDPGPKLRRMMEDHPQFWFQARRADGVVASHGTPPAGLADILPRLIAGQGLDIRWTHDGLEMIGESRRSPAGPITILTGGGGEISPFHEFLVDAKSYYLSLVGLLGLLTAIVIPVLLRREFRPISRVEHEAARIDIDRPGTRLDISGVPGELTGLVGAMNAALSRLDEGIDKRKRFLATAAHELRTPIAILMLRIETMPAGEERTRLLLDVSRLALLANQLLDWYRVESDARAAQPVDLPAVVAEALADIAPIAIAADCFLSLSTPDAPVRILADPQALTRVVINLVQNAIAHGGQGTSISVEVDDRGTLRIGDDGPGIAAADQPHVFDPFFRATGAGTGAGLGLNLVRDIVLHYGGKVRVATAPQGGALFIVQFPLTSDQAG